MKTVKDNHPKRVILAVDLKSEDPTLTKRIWSVLEPMIKNQKAVVEPLTILNREDAAIGMALRSRIGKLRTATERHLGEQLAEMRLEGLAPPKVLFADGSSTQRAVMALLSHAKKTGCDLIAISSRNRRGLKRLFLGSFAETLSLQSPIPLLVVNPNQKTISGKLRKILFPTDFSSNSRKALEVVCRSFREHKPTIVLFHRYQLPTPFYMEPFASYPIPQSMIDDDYKKTQRLSRQWVRDLRDMGIPGKIIVDRKSLVVTEGILSAAKREKVGMIAMVSTTGKLEAGLLGSTTRQVLRSSPRPVWVIHPAKSPEAQVIKFRRPDVTKPSNVRAPSATFR